MSIPQLSPEQIKALDEAPHISWANCSTRVSIRTKDGLLHTGKLKTIVDACKKCATTVEAGYCPKCQKQVLVKELYLIQKRGDILERIWQSNIEKFSPLVAEGMADGKRF